MMIFVTPNDTDNRFVVYLKTSVCSIFYDNNGLYFVSTLSKVNIIKDFFINYGIQEIEVQENGQDARLIVHDKNVTMKLDDSDKIAGIKVPILTIL